MEVTLGQVYRVNISNIPKIKVVHPVQIQREDLARGGYTGLDLKTGRTVHISRRNRIYGHELSPELPAGMIDKFDFKLFSGQVIIRESLTFKGQYDQPKV